MEKTHKKTIRPSKARKRTTKSKVMQALRKKKQAALVLAKDPPQMTTPPVMVVEDFVQHSSAPLASSPTPSVTKSDDYNFCNMDEETYQSIMEETIEVQSTYDDISGNRIVDLGYVLQWAVTLQYNHGKNCNGWLYPFKEHHRGLGLIRQIEFRCTVCDYIEQFSTQRPDNEVPLINYSAVWGTLAIGGTFGQLEELLCTMDIPPMNKPLFLSIEKTLGEVWHDELEKTLERNINEEKQIATSNGCLDNDGYPYSTAYVDCGWSKRSWGHSYDASSGVAVIVGKLTKKILFLGVRNKYCAICARASNKRQPARVHVCYKNWTSSSGAMEADIIVEGFCHLEKQHQLRLKTFIADGDSSVHAKLIEKVSYGNEIKKVECTNHCIKNYGKHLYRVKNDTSINLNARKQLTAHCIKRLQDTAQKSINHCKTLEELQHDLRNGPLHVFGQHTECKSYYCTVHGSDGDITEVKKTGLYNHVYGALGIVLRKSSQLLGNETTNCVETFMNVAGRFNAGKRLNLTTRGSYERRMQISGLRYNKSFCWHRSPWKKLTKKSPGNSLKKYMKRHTREAEMKSRRKLFGGHRKNTPKTKEVPKNVEKQYGPSAVQPDIAEDELKVLRTRTLEMLQISKEEIEFIELNSKAQFNSELFITERHNRLTASNFGQVVNRRPSTSCHNLVKNILYQKPFNTAATEYGKTKEHVAIKKLEEQLNITVQPAGFFVYAENGCLGASPDGLVGDTHCVEVKCLFSVQKSGSTLLEATRQKKTCLEIITNDQMRLKRQHPYWYQVQGQLNITNRTHCYFVIYVRDGEDVFVEEIARDEEQWKKYIYPKLKQFYDGCILEEIIRKNIPRGGKCFEPTYIVNAQMAKRPAKRKLQKSNSVVPLEAKRLSQDIDGAENRIIYSPLPTHFKSITLSEEILTKFRTSSSDNTSRNIETCGILAGVLTDGQYVVTHLLLPQQRGTSNTCHSSNEEELVDYQITNSLITLGWIHTHPTQTAFLSSVDLHTQYGYQQQLAEAIAIVHAPQYGKTEIFHLTEAGIGCISKCPMRGFHEHDPKLIIFDIATHVITSKNPGVGIIVQDFRG